MKWSYSIIAVIILGLFSLFILFLFEEATVANEQDYYNLKETTEASMYEAVDVAYYRDTGNIKIIQEKFIESFLRRFSQNQKLDNYNVQFYDIMEEPAKVTVKVSNDTNTYNIYGSGSRVKVVNKLSAILDTPDDEFFSNYGDTCTRTRIIYSAPWGIPYGRKQYEGYFKLNDWDGYKATSITYVGSWRTSIGSNIQVAVKLMDTYEENKEEVFESYSDNVYNAIPRSNFTPRTFANIYNMNTSVDINESKVITKFAYECEDGMLATVNNETKEVCMLGAMYRVEYKKDNCN